MADDGTTVEEFGSSRSAGSGTGAGDPGSPAAAASAAAPAPDAAARPSTPRTETIAAQRQEIEQLKAALADRDSQIKKLRSELAAGKGASTPAPSEPENAQETGSAPTGSTKVTTPRAKVTSHSGMSQGGKGVGAKSGQLAQAAFTDYESLFDSAFAAVREITTNSQEIIKAGLAKDEAQLCIEMAQSALYPLDQIRTLFRESEEARACRNGRTVGMARHARSGRSCRGCPRQTHVGQWRGTAAHRPRPPLPLWHGAAPMLTRSHAHTGACFCTPGRRGRTA